MTGMNSDAAPGSRRPGWVRDVSVPHSLDELRDRFRAVLVFGQPDLVGTQYPFGQQLFDVPLYDKP